MAEIFKKSNQSSLYADSGQESDLTSILEILAKVNSEINSLLECFYLSGLFLFMKLFERMTDNTLPTDSICSWITNC